jgi:hypothetical protein
MMKNLFPPVLLTVSGMTMSMAGLFLINPYAAVLFTLVVGAGTGWFSMPYFKKEFRAILLMFAIATVVVASIYLFLRHFVKSLGTPLYLAFPLLFL